MDIKFCRTKCNIGVAASKTFLDNSNSAFDAVVDFWHFTDECFATCPFKDVHVSK